MSITGEDIKRAIKRSDFTIDEAAKLLGMSRQNLYGYFTSYAITDDFLQNVKNKLNIDLQNVNGIVTTQEPFEPYKKLKPNAKSIDLQDFNILQVPLVQEYAYAGYLGGFSDNEYIEDLPTVPFITDKQAKGNYMAFQVRGDSMNDGSLDSYIQGDIVLCREINKVHWINKLHINKWDFIIVHQTEGILLKKIINHIPETGEITIHSLNPFYEDMVLNLAEVSQLFNIVKVERKK